MEDALLKVDLKCNTDKGGLKALHFWSRGMFFIVSAGAVASSVQQVLNVYFQQCQLC